MSQYLHVLLFKDMLCQYVRIIFSYMCSIFVSMLHNLIFFFHRQKIKETTKRDPIPSVLLHLNFDLFFFLHVRII